MELSKLPFTLKPQNTVSDLSIAPYVPFARVVPVDQTVVGLPSMRRAPSIPDDHTVYMTSKWINMNVLSLDEEPGGGGAAGREDYPRAEGLGLQAGAVRLPE